MLPADPPRDEVRGLFDVQRYHPIQAASDRNVSLSRLAVQQAQPFRPLQTGGSQAWYLLRRPRLVSRAAGNARPQARSVLFTRISTACALLRLIGAYWHGPSSRRPGTTMVAHGFSG
jgi:hypothetical protein